MDLSRVGKRAGVGLILELVGNIMFFFGLVLSVPGMVVFLMGIYELSLALGEDKLLSRFLIAKLLNIAPVVVLALYLLETGSLDLEGALPVLIVAAVLKVISLLYSSSAFELLSRRFPQSYFGAVSSLYKWGAILLPVFGFGLAFVIFGDFIAIAEFLGLAEKTRDH